MALISLRHVSKIYPHASRPALDDISLQIDRGEFVFLVGASGAGKSTLLSLLLHEEEATDGDIRVAGNDLRRMPNRHVPQYRRTIGFVFQDYKLLANKTVYQNVAFSLEVIGTKRSTIKTLVPQVLDAVGLKGKEDRLPHELSGGEVQRVAIARAYVNHPQIIMADEPTGNLDPTTSVGIMEVLDAINRTGTTVVMATHNEEIVNSMRRRVIELHNGQIVRDERRGGYDSSVYFPDEDTEKKSAAQKAASAKRKNPLLAVPSSESDLSAFPPDSSDSVTIPQPSHGSESADGQEKNQKNAASSNQASSDQSLSTVSPPNKAQSGKDRPGLSSTKPTANPGVDDDQEEGLRRLANSVHSGRTGRYAETFQSVEDTLTWGKGLTGSVEAHKNEDKTDNPTEDNHSLDAQSDQSDQINQANATNQSDQTNQTDKDGNN